MNIFPIFQTILYTISTALLYPVVIMLILLSLWLVLYSGGFIAEGLKRRQFRKDRHLANFLEDIHTAKQLPAQLRANLPLHVSNYAREVSDIIDNVQLFQEERLEDLNQRQEYDLIKEVDKIRLIVRIGPSLGLMGTLIPMGTGLAGLTQGDMAQLSSSLILAFTTTVVGLALGITAHFFSVIKERWVTEDMRHINLITEALVADEIPEEK
ncbi:MAG: MotA/TolQ/ExbB proton channel family protein [Desulfobulbaceae bacterium]|jgi:biopolymer transport protein ExbB/TolQ|nr:MotA/TolQ/ExbB proton channel family protein [Desulfobulbaceae bacterium]